MWKTNEKTLSKILAVEGITTPIQDWDTIVEEIEYVRYAVYLEDGRKFTVTFEENLAPYVEQD